MPTGIRRLLQDHRVAFVVVGGINTAVGYVTYACVFFVLSRHISHRPAYLTALALSYVAGMSVAFPLHRRFVFRVSGTGSVVRDFARFVSVNLTAIALNFILLPLLIERVHINAYVSQMVALVMTTLLSYFGHRYFSFARGRD